MTSPVLLPAGHAILAADLDAYENLTALPTSYTPIWTATSVNPVIGNGTISGSYDQVGKLLIVRGALVAGSTTTFGTGGYLISLPVTADTTRACVGSVYMQDAGVQNYSGTCLSGSTTISFFASTGGIGPTTPFTFGNGDQLSWTLICWAA